MVTEKEASSRHSSLREKIVEHLFLGEILRILWCAGGYNIEVSRAESDSFGYDVVIERGKIVRHIQLKSRSERKPVRISISRSLAEKPSGCVICVMLDSDLKIGPFLWFGSEPGKPLTGIEAFAPSKRIRRAPDGKRPPRANHVNVPMRKFDKISTTSDLVMKLFG